MLLRSNVAFGRRFVSDTTLRAQNQTTSGQFSASTKKLFKAIDDEILEDFKQALEDGANVDTFDKGYTSLMTIIMNGDDSPTHLKMMILLLQHQSLNINTQEIKEHNTVLHLAFLMENRSFVEILLRHPNLDLDVKNSYLLTKPEYLQLPAEYIRDSHKERFFHAPKEYIEKIGQVQKKDFLHLTIEIQKAQTGKEFLNALSNGGIYRVEGLLNQALNPNCWKRNLNGEIETPFSLIIRSCLEEITRDKEEVLTKLLKHEELDFSQTKPIPAIEQNSQLKQMIERAMKERLTNAISRKDLDDVKKLVEDNCFMNDQIVIEAFESFECIKNYLNEKFSTNAGRPVENIPADFEGFVQELVGKLERTKAQLAEKERELNNVVREGASKIDKISQLERDLKQIRQEKLKQQTRISVLTNQVTQLTRENAQLRTQNQDLNESLNDENKKSFKSSTQNGKQNGYAVTSFVLSGGLAIGACLTILNLEICIPLAIAALGLFLIGCYFLYKRNEQGVGPSGATDNLRITRVFTSSPGSAENFYTC